ncbi:hypothetical protein L227DRAFT_386275 [Lentinus tigrinus ALCF2SS1-6]|uniref:Uncharacterized protein n=1 Tax=Lentinus tigrinus ALCF2SS1-6 TaxID=1328759 RepID=A0A5C2SIC3_9APHY|nr:hypothetical protein L227DRAFT_386275 [Lentinus tigrinus ALCF2SS1-6]
MGYGDMVPAWLHTRPYERTPLNSTLVSDSRARGLLAHQLPEHPPSDSRLPSTPDLDDDDGPTFQARFRSRHSRRTATQAGADARLIGRSARGRLRTRSAKKTQAQTKTKTWRGRQGAYLRVTYIHI